VVVAHYKKDDLLNCWTSSSDISGYDADFHEGDGNVGAGQGRGMAGARHGHGIAMCESALTLHTAAVGTAWYCSARLGTAREHYSCFKNIYSVASTFVASVTAGVFDTGIKSLVMHAQLFPSSPLSATPHNS
jgi:hypothetical protein